MIDQNLRMTDPILYLSMILGLGGVYVLIASFNDDDGENPMDELKNYTKKRRLSETSSKAKKSKSVFKLPRFGRD